MAGWADSAWSPLQLNTTNWGQNTSHPRCYSTISTQGLVDLVRRRSMRCGVVVGSNITIAVMTDCDGGGRDRLESERSLSPRTPVTLRTDGRTPPRHCFLSVPLRDPPPPSPHLPPQCLFGSARTQNVERNFIVASVDNINLVSTAGSII